MRPSFRSSSLRPSRPLLSVLAVLAALPVMAYAQSAPIVPPPQMPGQVPASIAPAYQPAPAGSLPYQAAAAYQPPVAPAALGGPASQPSASQLALRAYVGQAAQAHLATVEANNTARGVTNGVTTGAAAGIARPVSTPAAVTQATSVPAPVASAVSAPAPVGGASGAQGVIPADRVASPTAGAAAPGNLLDIAMPDKPQPDAPGAVLKPSAPAIAAPGHNAHKVKAKSVKGDAKPAAEEKKVAPPDPFEGIQVTPVSDSQLNRFVFPEAVEGVFFAEGAPLPDCPPNATPTDLCHPVFLNARRVMLLQLRAGAKGPVQMVTQLHSGRIVTLDLAPMPGPGAIVRIDNAEDGASDARLADDRKNAASASLDPTMTDSESNVAMLARFAKGDIPGGFEPTAVGGPVRYDFFDVIPMASWTDGANWRVHLVQVKAFTNQPVAINAGLFRNERVRAIALDRETITDSAPAQMYLLEYVPTEQN